MIGYIQGEIVFLDLTYVVIEAGGIGYEIKISINTFARIKDLKQARLYTHLHIKEDAHVLYGFFDVIEKNLFTQLISISGVGPGTAIMILSSMEVQEIEKEHNTPKEAPTTASWHNIPMSRTNSNLYCALT